MLPRQIVPPRDLSHRRPAHTNLAQDRSLLNIRPPAPPFSTCQNLLPHIIPTANDVVNDVNNDSGLEQVATFAIQDSQVEGFVIL